MPQLWCFRRIDRQVTHVSPIDLIDNDLDPLMQDFEKLTEFL
ncbi:MAG TPA: hypothetical protein VK968_18270 [Roseimicrobium sp.]|nr:hypothetical protein [Roseimicrobium sp.]